MKTFAGLPEYVQLIIAKQFDMVGASTDNFDFDNPEWYKAYQWDQATEDQFKIWMDEQLRTNKAMRKIAPLSAKNKKYREGTIDWWLLMYGWPLKH